MTAPDNLTIPYDEYADKNRMLRWFSSAHLPAPLAEVNEPFRLLAEALVKQLPLTTARTSALYKLTKARDAALVARMEQEDPE